MSVIINKATYNKRTKENGSEIVRLKAKINEDKISCLVKLKRRLERLVVELDIINVLGRYGTVFFVLIINTSFTFPNPVAHFREKVYLLLPNTTKMKIDLYPQQFVK